MTRIDIYSGFLGAGKTTLIKKMIKEAYSGEKLVLIENEFGEIGIDGGFLQEAGIAITRDRLERDFLQYDQEAMLRRVPLRHDADYLYLTFLRREYRIDRKTGRVEWSDDGFQTAHHAGHDEVGTIFDYLCCADPSVPLTGEYVSVNQLDGAKPPGAWRSPQPGRC